MSRAVSTAGQLILGTVLVLWALAVTNAVPTLRSLTRRRA